MKKFLFSSAVAMFFLISCHNAPSGTTAGTTSSQNDLNIANSLKIYKAIQTGDMSAIDTLIASDAIDHDGPNGTEIKGRDSIVKMLGDIHNHIKDINFDVITSAANDDYVFSLVHITGTSADSSMGMPGKSFDEKGVDVIKLKDNKISDHWGFTDDAQVSKEMMEMRDKMNSMDKMKK
ncbi:MAG TPA: nuclear transport factor 2 family protein [Hanamia sp.]|nr:nuclear transport factor 2 family protein [Hanamia sp.]